MACFDSEKFACRYMEAASTAESEPELLFQTVISRLLCLDAQLTPQFNYETRRGRYRADFLLVTAGGERIIIEIDGKQFHDPIRDKFRDAFTLADGYANHIYRFKAETIFRHIWHAVYALYRHHLGVFSDYGIQDIRDKASRFVASEELHPANRPFSPASFLINSAEAHDTQLAEISRIEVRSGINKRGARLFGREYIDFARENPGKDIDWLTNQWKLEHPETRKAFVPVNWPFEDDAESTPDALDDEYWDWLNASPDSDDWI